MIDINFNFYSDAKGPDPDSSSPMLKKYHQLLWSKELPNGKQMNLINGKSSYYLGCKIGNRQFYFGSDAIIASYRDHRRFYHIIKQLPNETQELYYTGSTIAGYIIFPNNRVDNKHTINQARGIKRIISDRFDLTLECIKRYYNGNSSPLSDVIDRYSGFFDLFHDFKGYTAFFLLQDLLDSQGNINFYLPFDNFQTNPDFRSTNEYIVYQQNVMKFINQRSRRIQDFANKNSL